MATVLGKLDDLRSSDVVPLTVRSRTLLLEKLRCKIKNETDATEKEEKCLAEYRSEIAMLLQEKAEHVELLRLIHADINGIESIIKQSDDDCKQSKEKIRRLVADYQPVKKQIDELRTSIGLGRLVDASVEAAALCCVDSSSAAATSDLSCGGGGTKRKQEDTLPRAGGRAASRGGSPDADPVQHAGSSVLVVGPATALATADDDEGPDGKLRVRQQLPPMKFCSSCHQQIHRNAPICPLCKAKSHSRNPKKGKKKE